MKIKRYADVRFCKFTSNPFYDFLNLFSDLFSNVLRLTDYKSNKHLVCLHWKGPKTDNDCICIEPVCLHFDRELTYFSSSLILIVFKPPKPRPILRLPSEGSVGEWVVGSLLLFFLFFL